MSISSSSSDGDEGATQPDAPAHALTYFSHRAALRCDLTQLLFALSDTPLTIERVLYPEFLQQKATYPGGQLPVLRHGGRAVGQSKAIARYAATLGDLWSAVLAIDVDGDGDVDVLSAAYDDDAIAWHENDGSQGFTEHVISDIFRTPDRFLRFLGRFW